MKIKKWLSTAALGMLLATSLVACSSNEDSTSDNGTNAEGSNEVVNVEWWGWAPQPERGKELADAFNAAHPDINVTFKRLEDYDNQLKVAMLSNEGPDVIGLRIPMLAQYKDYLVPLDDEIKGYIDDYVQLGLEQTQLDGKQVALPVGFTGQAYLMYNKTLLDKYGVTPPTNMEETKAVIETIKSQDSNVIPLQLGAKDAWIDVDVFNVLSQQVAPGKFYEAIDGKISWTDPSMVETAKLWKQLFDERVFQEGALGLLTYMDGMNNFFDQKAAMWVIGSWEAHSMTAIEKKEKWNNFTDEIGFVPFPDMVGDGSNRPIVAGVDMALAVNNTSDEKVQAAAKKFIKFVTHGEGQQLYMQALEMAPAIKGLQVDTEGLFDNQLAVDSLAVLNDTIANAVGGRNIPNPKVNDTLGRALQDIAQGKDIEKALQQVEDASK